MKMLKYSFTKDDGTFSPTHLQTGTDSLMKETIDVNVNPRSRAKMVMKRRARQKRGHDFHVFPPISNTPQSNRKEIMTPYINGESDVPYINALGISRVHDVSTPYVMHTNVSKRDAASPTPHGEIGSDIRKEYTRVSQMTHHNVVEVNKKPERSSSHEQINKVGKVSPFIERRSRLDHHPHFRERKRIERHYASTVHDNNDKNNKLQIQSNQMGLVQRAERQRTRDNRLGKADEPFSIRKKIEQFRRWHEEQYKEKLKRLKEEVDIQYEVEHRKLQNSRLGESPGETDKSLDRHNNGQDRKHYKRELVSQHVSSTEHNSSKNGADRPTEERSVSERTWHTWRDVNESYAYDDVKKYIEDNELMNKEKEDWIQKWIIEVETALQSENSDDSSV